MRLASYKAPQDLRDANEFYVVDYEDVKVRNGATFKEVGEAVSKKFHDKYRIQLADYLVQSGVGQMYLPSGTYSLQRLPCCKPFNSYQ